MFDLDSALARIRGRGPALVLMHDNPDPDSMAAAEGLRALLEAEAKVPVTVARGGIIGRAENRAMVSVLGLRHVAVAEIDFARFPIIALADTQPETGNNSLPPGHRVDIVVDHHPLREQTRRAPWCDVRDDFGASSTIVYSYLLAKRIALPVELATAMFYAIKSETRDLGRESSEHEYNAYTALIRQADLEKVHAIAEPKVPAAYFGALDRAIRSAEVRGRMVTVNLGTLDYPDLVAEVADLLLAFERAHWALCTGQHHGYVYLSLRTDLDDANAGQIIRAIVGERGAAGGHGMVAGGKLHQPIKGAEELQAIYVSLALALARELGVESGAPVPLLPH